MSSAVASPSMASSASKLLMTVVVVLNVVVSFALYRDGGLNGLQKIAQAAIVWLLPVVGAVSILMLIASHHSRSEMKRLVPFPLYLAAPARYQYAHGPDKIMHSDLTGDELGEAHGDGD